MSSKEYNNDAMAGDSGSSTTSGFGVRCLARVAAPQPGLSRVRLSVTEPRWCFPFFGKRRVIASFTFSEDDWAQAFDGVYEAYTAYCPVDLAKFRHLQGDLPVTVKWWVGRQVGKTRLDDTLGDVLHLLYSRSHLTLQVVAGSHQASVCWAALNDEVFNTTLNTSATGLHTFINNTSGRTITLPAHEEVASSATWVFPGAWTSQDDQLDEEDLRLLDTLNCASSHTVTFVNNSSGRTITLPAHEEPAMSAAWVFPGAWTSQDDQLDEEDLRLLQSFAERRNGGHG